MKQNSSADNAPGGVHQPEYRKPGDRFSRTGFTDETEYFPPVDGKTDIIHRLNRSAFHKKVGLEVCNGYDLRRITHFCNLGFKTSRN